jgi:hypothetical protein
VTPEPVAQPIVGFRHWAARRGGLYSGIFVAGRFVPNPALAMIAPRAIPVPWPTDHDRNARCFALGGHDAPHANCGCGYSAYYALPDEPDLPAPEAVWGAIVAGGGSSNASAASAPSSPVRSPCSTAAARSIGARVASV